MNTQPLRDRLGVEACGTRLEEAIEWAAHRHDAMAFGTNDDKLVARERLAVEHGKNDLVNFDQRGSFGPVGRSG